MDMAFVAAAWSSVRPIDSLESQYKLLGIRGRCGRAPLRASPSITLAPIVLQNMLFTLSSIGVLAQGILSVGLQDLFPCQAIHRTDASRLTQFSCRVIREGPNFALH